MRKFVLVLLLLCSIVILPAFAAVDVQKDGSSLGAIEHLNIIGDGVTVTKSGNQANVNIPIASDLLATGLYDGDVTIVVTGTTVLSGAYKVARVYVTNRTLNLSNGTEGQILTLIGEDLTDTGTLTITATTATGWSSVSLDSVRDTVTFLYVDDTYGWIVIGNNSVTVS